MSLDKLETKVRRPSRQSKMRQNEKLRRAQELLQEVDSLALLLDEVKKQSEKIQAAADAIGDEFLSNFRTPRGSALSAEGPGKRQGITGPKLVSRSRSDGAFPV